MSRTKVFDEDKALQAAMLLFWEKGYEATSMQALEQAMQLKRTSIYNAFGNKRALFQRVLQRYLTTILSRFLAAVREASTTKGAIKDVLTEVINLHFNRGHPGGCLVALSLLESHQHDKDTKVILDSALRQLNQAIIERLEHHVEEGEITANLECHHLANEVTALITGMLVMAKANFKKQELQRLVDNFIQNQAWL